MHRRKRSKRGGGAQLEMTPMIDVVFQLLIFFIVTLHQDDVLARLDLLRPRLEPIVTGELVSPALEIRVTRDAYLVRGQRFGLDALDQCLARVAPGGAALPVMIHCAADSPHRRLVDLLDVCAKQGLRRVGVASL